jgi:hypothetical protein
MLLAFAIRWVFFAFRPDVAEAEAETVLIWIIFPEWDYQVEASLE